MVAGLGFQIIGALFQLWARGRTQKSLLLEEPSQGRGSKTKGAARLKEVTPGTEARRRRCIDKTIHNSVEVEIPVGSQQHLAQCSQRALLG